MLPRHEIVEIKYFTAIVRPRSDDVGVADRQRTFLRALRTLPNFYVYEGHFIAKQVRMRLVRPRPSDPATVLVHQSEEKGSDVNLASHLLIDGFKGRYECAVVVSNDGDLKHPVEWVRNELGLRVGVLNPHPKRSWALSPSNLPDGSFYKPIRRGPIEASWALFVGPAKTAHRPRRLRAQRAGEHHQHTNAAATITIMMRTVTLQPPHPRNRRLRMPGGVLQRRFRHDGTESRRATGCSARW